MELTGNFFDHMDKSSNVKKMKGFFQQKNWYFEGYDLKPKNMNNSQIYYKQYHIMSNSKVLEIFEAVLWNQRKTNLSKSFF